MYSTSNKLNQTLENIEQFTHSRILVRYYTHILVQLFKSHRSEATFQVLEIVISAYISINLCKCTSNTIGNVCTQ
jgi:hypothetical protein